VTPEPGTRRREFGNPWDAVIAMAYNKRPEAFKLSPKTQAKLDAYLAKKKKTQ